MSNDFDRLEGSGVKPCTVNTTYKYNSVQELEDPIGCCWHRFVEPSVTCRCGKSYLQFMVDTTRTTCPLHTPDSLMYAKSYEYTINTKTEHGVTTESFELTKMPENPVDLIFTRQDDHTLSPVATMSQLRISYQSVKSTKDSRSKQLAFIGCTNLPEKLPPYLEVVQPELKPTKARTQLSEITKILGNASRLTISTDKHGNVTTEVETLVGLSRQIVYTTWQLQHWDIELMTVLEGMSKR